MRTTTPTNMTTFTAEPMVKVYSEQQRLSETAPVVSVTDRDFALVRESQSPLVTKFCAECHAAMAYERDEVEVAEVNDGNGNDMNINKDGSGRGLRFLRIDDDESDHEHDDDVEVDDALVDDMAALCGSCREQWTRATRYARREIEDGMTVDLETTATPPPPPAVHPLSSAVDTYAQERPTSIPVNLSRRRPTITIPRPQPQSQCARTSPHSPSETHLRRTSSSSSTSSPFASTSVRHPSPASAIRQHQSQDDHLHDADPLIDITRLRVRSNGYRSLYPGATFQGTQKSGRNSYDVTVTIVDIDFASSYLCGYLRIRGLTDDWPELTTYFDAEIVGDRYGFLTQDWGATDKDDMTHWGRFAAFSTVQPDVDVTDPKMTVRDNKRYGAVFMRWKERFLVPDHRVQDINGASFAGFYYICVEFAPPKQQHSGNESGVSVNPYDEPEATMCGYYFHQNSEPYQQLSLTHVPDRFTSTFEFR